MDAETKRPCARLPDTDRESFAASVSGDPAMVFMFRMASILPMVRASYPVRPAAGLLLDTIALSLPKTPAAIRDQARGWLLAHLTPSRLLQASAPGRRMI